ncbi:MAG: hypothetical protein CMH55_09480 [Myxococcales bacterium]|nr:hypothetical protein [Myxococcales bacterium]
MSRHALLVSALFMIACPGSEPAPGPGDLPPDGECIDHDRDGYGPGCAAGPDCDNNDGRVNSDCAGSECVDGDGDGFGENCDAGPDCDDADPAKHDDCGSVQNCNPGEIATNCPCNLDAPPVSCWDGPPEALNVGICTSGSMSCLDIGGRGVWGRCEGQQLPQANERCNEMDDNCDGRVDEGVQSACGNCNPHCYAGGAGPENGEPFEEPNEGNGSGVGLDEDGNLVLNREQVRFEYLWVANAGEGTVSKVDTSELREVGRFHTVGPNQHNLTPGQQNSPSRTGIDLNGDMFVANRAFGRQGSFTKIYNADCVDANDDGEITTSQDINNNNIIDRDNPQEFPGNNDECFAFTKPVGGNNGMARALAIDAGDAASPYGNVWVGLYQSRQFYGFQGTDGALLEREGLENPVAVGHSPYGAVVDSNGYVWSGTLSRGTIVGFDSRTGRASGVFSPNGGPPASSYGFSIDGENRLWVGAQGNGMNRYNPYRDNQGNPIQDPLAGGGEWRNTPCIAQPCYMRGMGADAQGRIWVANNYGSVSAWNVNNMQAIGNYPIGGSSVSGAGVDFNGFAWGVSGNGFTARIDPNNPDDVRRVNVGGGPYTYSDFTGFGLRNFTAPRGGYKTVVEGCEKLDTDWLSLDATATLPEDTRVEFRARVADDLAELVDPGLRVHGPWIQSADGQNDLPADLGELPPGRYLQLEIFLVSTDREATPVLRGYDVRFQCQIEE